MLICIWYTRIIHIQIIFDVLLPVTALWTAIGKKNYVTSVSQTWYVDVIKFGDSFAVTPAALQIFIENKENHTRRNMVGSNPGLQQDPTLTMSIREAMIQRCTLLTERCRKLEFTVNQIVTALVNLPCLSTPKRFLPRQCCGLLKDI